MHEQNLHENFQHLPRWEGRDKVNQQQRIHQAKLAFIGAGNIATAIISGLTSKGISPDNLIVADPADSQLAPFRDIGIRATQDNREAVTQSDVVILSVKPNVLPGVARDIAKIVTHVNPLIISVAAGITLTSLSEWLGDQLALVRCMPNTPALVQLGASGLYANNRVTTEQRELAEEIVNATGISVWLEDEKQLDAVTALSGSGPAYFFYMIEIMSQVGVKMGLTSECSRKLVLQTALGAATMAIQSADEPADLRRRVTSPGGTTAAALESMQNSNLADIIAAAIEAAHTRAVELSRVAEE
ncbi:MAG: pyrroline-5-carboxylate reductase [Gammaproteobacteria bacterium]|nr:pyrroline-5-carboxylate reductase [Gammaproteobacteria bacterium]